MIWFKNKTWTVVLYLAELLTTVQRVAAKNTMCVHRLCPHSWPRLPHTMPIGSTSLKGHDKKKKKIKKKMSASVNHIVRGYYTNIQHVPAKEWAPAIYADAVITWVGCNMQVLHSFSRQNGNNLTLVNLKINKLLVFFFRWGVNASKISIKIINVC